MFLKGLLWYLGRAVLLAVPVTAVASVMQKKKRPWVLAAVFYLTMLFSATVIRDGKHLLDFWTVPHTMDSVQMVPFLVTLKQGRAGAWYLFYPVAGNILWFLPLGFLLRRLRPGWKWYHGAAISLAASLSIEVLQWVLLSGISDIDDVIFNVLGGILGWGLAPCRQP